MRTDARLEKLEAHAVRLPPSEPINIEIVAYGTPCSILMAPGGAIQHLVNGAPVSHEEWERQIGDQE